MTAGTQADRPINNARRLGGVALAVLSMGICQSVNAAPPPQMPAGELQRAIDRLSVVGSVLYVAAHPDDENTRLLAWLVGERGLRVGYLSMTRGGGGQNLIGTEQAELLGVVRTGELLAARGVDGAEQRFSRMRDFGYSKTPDETLAIWGHDEALSDVVWTVRSFRPDVIITRFDTKGPNHGHHTASAILAGEAFTAAADPKRFADQLAHAPVWQADRLFENKSHWRMGPDTDTSVYVQADVGTYDPLIGASYGEVAAHSRTMHKSQGFGSTPDRAPIVEYFDPVAGTVVKPGADLLSGLDLSWGRYKGTEALAKALAAASAEFDPRDPAKVLPRLAEAHRLMAQVPDPHWRAVKTAELEVVMLACAGVWLDALGEAPSVTPGAALEVTLVAMARAPGAEVTLSGVQIEGGPKVAGGKLGAKPWQQTARLTVAPGHAPSRPHWLREAPSPAQYRIDDQTLRATADLPGALRATFTVEIAGRRFIVERAVAYTRTDAVLGERRQPVEVLPPVTASFDNPAVVLPRGTPNRVRLTLNAATGAAAKGTLELGAPAGYTVTPRSVPFALTREAPEQIVDVTITARPDAAPGALVAEAVVAGKRWSMQATVIDYDHLPRRTVLRPASLGLVPLDLDRGKTARIGYVAGPGDTVAEALRQVGYTVEEIGVDDIAGGDLSRFDAIVTGIRAYNAHPRLMAQHGALMRYVERGGRLIVQYNTNNRFNPLEGLIGPWPFTISRDRVTDETAAMTPTAADHPALTRPNRLGAADYAGWVQERGLYFADAVDQRYERVFSMHDVGEKPLDGSLIVARHGKGAFVYTGISFFRQLPAGVPGAFRLFANLLAL